MVRLEWGSATDVGRVRSRNEDSFIAAPPLFAIADGMGGHARGDLASALTVEILGALAGRPQLARGEVEAAIEACNIRIVEEAAARAADEGMGTTLTGIALVEAASVEHWLAFNIGDSRVYRFAGGQLTQVTVDHSELQEILSSGRRVDWDEATNRLRHVVTRSLGADEHPEPDYWLLPVSPGERFLLCSDGLTNELSDDELVAGLSARAAADCARLLVEGALAAGGRDNVTAVVVEVADDGALDEDTTPRQAAALLISGVPDRE